ncbi:hypothetical protein B0H14DRAFT_3496478 [Mycena olivaceomarginata]|nr:hypothetical protein B0H14DRAFT_3496478 [Mycena olivaceomarginata]
MGVGLRLAQDIGLRARKIPARAPSVESEQYKRAFWILVFLDRVTSAEMGRACALQYEDFDVDPLIEVDDEYWGNPLHLFHQPPVAPSRVENFNAVMGLGHLRAFCVQDTKLLAANRGRKRKPSPSCIPHWTPGSRRFRLICGGTLAMTALRRRGLIFGYVRLRRVDAPHLPVGYVGLPASTL